MGNRRKMTRRFTILMSRTAEEVTKCTTGVLTDHVHLDKPQGKRAIWSVTRDREPLEGLKGRVACQALNVNDHNEYSQRQQQ